MEENRKEIPVDYTTCNGCPGLMSLAQKNQIMQYFRWFGSQVERCCRNTECKFFRRKWSDSQATGCWKLYGTRLRWFGCLGECTGRTDHICFRRIRCILHGACQNRHYEELGRGWCGEILSYNKGRIIISLIGFCRKEDKLTIFTFVNFFAKKPSGIVCVLCI